MSPASPFGDVAIASNTPERDVRFMLLLQLGQTATYGLYIVSLQRYY